MPIKSCDATYGGLYSPTLEFVFSSKNEGGLYLTTGVDITKQITSLALFQVLFGVPTYGMFRPFQLTYVSWFKLELVTPKLIKNAWSPSIHS